MNQSFRCHSEKTECNQCSLIH